MLTEEEIRRIAKRRNMSVGLTEKDYVIEWLLKGIYESEIKDNLIFKGGTAIKKGYFQETWRFSHDLDFTAFNIDSENIKNQLKGVFKHIEMQSSLKLEFKSFHITPGSIIANVQFSGPLNAKNRIRVDVSLDENVVTEPIFKIVASQYPDIAHYHVNAYSLNEILAEKIRSILQRGKSRDYYDVWMLLRVKKFDLNEIRGLLIEKCKLKGIEFKLESIFDEDKLKDARRFWDMVRKKC
jgi:predicted nucleotidyltransferase component of viral defense system